MPNAAAPAYMGQDLQSASPAMRFGLLLSIWTSRQDQEKDVISRAEARSPEADEVRGLLRQGMDRAIDVLQARDRRPLPTLWAKNDFASREAWRRMCALSAADLARMKALASRQSVLAVPLISEGCLVAMDAVSTAPFTTGLGNEHPLENGFSFLNPYGLPYLPGSGVKGVLRQAATELMEGSWGDSQGWTSDCIDALFGKPGKDGSEADPTHQRGSLTFWDVLPQLKGDSLQVEVMTPHHTHYHQKRTDSRSGGSTHPHDSGQPNPIHFLTIPPGSGFTFHVQCDLPYLARLNPDLAASGTWQKMVEAAFTHAFAWLGFGAKTAVGYGAMSLDESARRLREIASAQAQAEARAAAEAAALRAMSPEDAAWHQAQSMVERFRSDLAQAKAAGPFKPGQVFDQARQTFVKTALSWTEPRSRAAAAEALAESATKSWGRPSNKERWQELQKAIEDLKGAS